MSKARKPKRCKVSYEFHPLAAHYPLLEGDARAELRKSLEAIGCQNPAVIFEDMILDGRNRWELCDELGIECPVTEYKDDEPELFVEAMNGHRRHLSDNQKLLAAVALHKAREIRLQNLQGAKTPVNKRLSEEAVEKIAEETGVSERTVRTAAKVDDACAVGVKEAVRSGEIAVSDAAAIADLPKLDQAAALRAVKRGEANTLREAAGLTGDGKPKAAEPDELKDQLGTPVPDKYRAAFAARADFDAIGRELDAVWKKIEALAETDAGHYLQKELQSLKQSFKTFKGTFLWSKPHALAPERRGEPKWLSMYAYKQTDGAKA